MTGPAGSRSVSDERAKRLLIVVDGDAFQLYYTGIMLQRLEYNIYTTKAAEEALEIMNITVPSLVLTEVGLPRMDGMTLFKRMKQDPKLQSVPLIVYTKSHDPSRKDQFLREGAAAYLIRPVDPGVLYAAIQKATENPPRQYIRMNVCLSVSVGDGTPLHNPLEGDCITAISENGMYISTPEPMPVGTHQSFTFFLQNTKMNVKGTVLYSYQRGQGPLHSAGMGIRFTQITPEEQAMIQAFIRRQVTHALDRGEEARSG